MRLQAPLELSGLLIDEVERHLGGMRGLHGAPASRPPVSETVADLFVRVPTLREGPRNPVMERLIRKVDPAERDERNRALGRAGEEFVIEVKERRLHAVGRTDLMRDTRWVSRDVGNGAGLAIILFDPDTGRESLIKVKAMRGARTTPFFLTWNEEAVLRDRPGEWRLYMVFEFAAAPRIFMVEPPLDRAVSLKPAVWSASFR